MATSLKKHELVRTGIPAEKALSTDAAGEEGDFIPFTVDAALLRELGERLVGKPEVALAELVKNAYDADATEVRIVFREDAIEVHDNGSGMSRQDFERFWMRIGTTHKQADPTTPLGRVVTGSKGVGRLAVQFLGQAVNVYTRTGGARRSLLATVDWGLARKQGDLVKAGARLGTVPNAESLVEASYDHGTTIEISRLNDRWDVDTIRGLAQELWFLNPPLKLRGTLDRASEFAVKVEGLPDAERKAFDSQLRQALDNWIAVIRGDVTGGREGGRAKVSVKFRDGQTFSEAFDLPNRVLDEAHFEIRVYKLSHRQAGDVKVRDARAYFKQFGGVHIYDDGFRLPFYGGESEDWLSLEVDHSHRLTVSKLLPERLHVPSAMNDLPTTARVFGIVQVSTSAERRAANEEEKQRGAYLNVQITRDRLIDNAAFESLRYVVRWGIDFYASRSMHRRMVQAAEELLPAPDSSPLLADVRGRLSQVRAQVATPFKPAISAIEVQLDRFIKEDEQRQQTLANERILLGALATAGMGAVAIEHELGKELLDLRGAIQELLKVSSGDGKLSELLAKLQAWIDRTSATQRLFSPLMDQDDREKARPYRAREVLRSVARNSEALLKSVSVNLEGVDEHLRFPKATMSAWQAIFQNAFVNSINAMIATGAHEIRCRSQIDAASGQAALIVEDKGVGVDLETSKDLFKPFVRKLEIPEERKALRLGGVGMGLTIVRMIAESVGCEVQFVKPAPGYKAAFRLSWKEDKNG